MLNRVFNVVFNYSLGVFTAVSELSRRRLKTKSVSQSKSLQNIIRVNLSRLTLGVLIGCGIVSTPVWAEAGFKWNDNNNNKLVYCSDLADNGTCSDTVAVVTQTGTPTQLDWTAHSFATTGETNPINTVTTTTYPSGKTETTAVSKTETIVSLKNSSTTLTGSGLTFTGTVETQTKTYNRTSTTETTWNEVSSSSTTLPSILVETII